ncbi:hypothetical protein H0I31_01750 [Tenacibaculum sp. AHE15PA]|uniref:hypothetical protein n=1 Tax=Tenacibaculum TaxID=104267 RepID=UPI001C4F2F1A|nr:MULTISPECIES: hypothetical protein [Tenacibaculum]QXP72450.1 hypothetical protein H0I30_07005 [Tenacibaculum sp. AHE14PA]QXP76366.1 hypothetical protein H0I31_01750 [Tenacibaculum sp. AHE15PA]
MNTETLTKKETFVGGWTAYHALTTEDRKVFDEALKGFVGVSYTPNQVSTQVVAGVNYRFKCSASIPPSEVIWEAIVEIYQPLDGKAHITGITRL